MAYKEWHCFNYWLIYEWDLILHTCFQIHVVRYKYNEMKLNETSGEKYIIRSKEWLRNDTS